jgi:RHS repeat-associated protein
MKFYYNHLGSTGVVTNWWNGGVISSQKYDPWGKVRGGTGTITQTTISYTGQRLDGTGLLYYNARYYDPATAKFVSADIIVSKPSKPQSLNRYSYVLNNPLKYTDSSGYCPADRAADKDWCDAYDRAYYHRGWKTTNTIALQGLDVNELNNLFAWLERGVSFAQGSAAWSLGTLRSTLSGLNRVYNAFYSRFGENGVEGALRAVFSGVTIEIRAGVRNGNGTEVTTGGWNPVSNTISLDYNSMDEFATDRGQTPLERLTHIFLHEVGHVVSTRLGNYAQKGVWQAALIGPGPSNGSINPDEDFAESFAAWVNGDVRNGGMYVTGFRPNLPALDNKPSDSRILALFTALGQLIS